MTSDSSEFSSKWFSRRAILLGTRLAFVVFMKFNRSVIWCVFFFDDQVKGWWKKDSRNVLGMRISPKYHEGIGKYTDVVILSVIILCWILYPFVLSRQRMPSIFSHTPTCLATVGRMRYGVTFTLSFFFFSFFFFFSSMTRIITNSGRSRFVPSIRCGNKFRATYTAIRTHGTTGNRLPFHATLFTDDIRHKECNAYPGGYLILL